MKALLIGALSLGAVAFASSAWADDHHDHGASGGSHEAHESHSGGHESHSSEHIGIHIGDHGGGDHHFDHRDSVHIGIGHHDHVVGHVGIHHSAGFHGHVRLAHFHHVFRAPHRYHAGYWRAPYGFHYRRFGIGERIPGMLLASAYFLDDYYDYGLEEPDDGYVWVRDGSDAVLVDEETGEVIEVEYDVFY